MVPEPLDPSIAQLRDRFIADLDLQVITLDGKTYVVFNDAQMKLFFRKVFDAAYDSIAILARKHATTKGGATDGTHRKDS
jgi:hypothetical protein